MWEEARVLLMPVLSALGVLHDNGIIHGAISPNSLIVGKDGRVKITDFSIDDVRYKGGRLPLDLSEGYAAIEQYAEDGELGPWTDVYSFSTVLYRVLVGSTPMSSVSRATNDKLMIPGKFAEIIPAYVINALVNALQILPEDRTEDVELLRDDLSASPSAAVSAAERYSSMAANRRTERDEPQRIEDEEDVEDFYEDDYIPQKSGVKKSTIITLVVSVLVCLAKLVAVVIGITSSSGNGDDKTTSPNETVSNSENETEEQFINISVPDFRGKNIDDVKADETYKDVLSITTVYEDSDQEIGTVIAQDLPEGTMVSSINKRSITLKVSDGLKVPDLVGEDATEAHKQLTDKGFKDVEVKVSSIAETPEDSNKVTDVVYYPKDETEWQAIPDDRRISATLKVVIYCYGEYTPPETESPTQSIGENIDSIIEGVEGIGNIINEF